MKNWERNRKRKDGERNQRQYKSLTYSVKEVIIFKI